ncbi:response regulator transcription factor [Pseudonocardia tropica]|uniref:Response regulator transcription factor n=1 Tax=Pseudonocardia tropica TaxID=681289 RepID=A0ABV1K000_9PSEU
MTVRVILVDDQELVRIGFRMALDAVEGITVVGEADDGDTAVETVRSVEADVVLMDVRMPRMDGVEATRRIVEAGGPRILVLTTFDLDEYAYDALRAGAGGFLVKDTPLAELVAAIRHVHAGDAVVAPRTTRRLLEHVLHGRVPGPRRRRRVPGLDELTTREHEVLILVARGMSNSEIAGALTLSGGTVKVHVSRILSKLGLRDRVQAVVLAYESGVVGVGEEGTGSVPPRT